MKPRINDRVLIPGTGSVGTVQGFDSTGQHLLVLQSGSTPQVYLPLALFGAGSYWLLGGSLLFIPNQTLSVAIGGSSVTFSTAFLFVPVVSVQLIGSNAVSSQVTSISPTGFTVQCFDATGAAVAATVSWNAIGM
jgi:hypothetical protein